MSFCDDLVELICRFTFIIITYVTWVLLGEIIAAHQHGIMRRSLQLQRLLHLPACTHIFSEGDTKIHQGDIKAAAIALFFTILFVSAGTLIILIEGPTSALSRPGVLCSVIALMVTPGLLLWLRLALTCRRRKSDRRAVAWDIEDVSTDDTEMTRGEGANENIALLSSEREPKAGKADKEEDDQLKQDGPSKKEVDVADKSRGGDGRDKKYTPLVTWDNSELPFAFMF